MQAWIRSLPLVITLLSFGPNLGAAPRDITYFSIVEASLDDSHSFEKWAQDVYRASRGQAMGPEIPVILFAYHWVTGEVSETRNLEADFKSRVLEALRFAEDNALFDDVIRLKLVMMQRFPTPEQTEEGEIKQYQSLIKLCDELQLPITKARLLADLSRLARITGHPQVASESIEKAMNIIKEQSVVPIWDRLVIKTRLAGYLGQNGLDDKALDVYRELVVLAKANKVRQFQSDMEFNIARILAKSSREADLLQALHHYQNAFEIDSKLGNQNVMGISLVGMSEVKEKLQKYDEGIRQATQGLMIFQRLGNQSWEGEAWKILGRMHLKTRNLVAAEEAFKKADEIFSDTYQEDKYDIFLGYADVLAEAKRYQQAFQSLKKAHHLLKSIHTDDFNNKRAEATNRLEVMLAEERTRVLQKENELQQKEIEFGRGLKKAIVAVALLCLGLGLLLILAMRLSNRLKRANQKMHVVLENIEQGIFTLDKSLSISPDYSWHLRQMLGDFYNGDGRDGIDIVFSKSDLTSETISVIREVLNATLDEEALAWELNESKLPREISYVGELERTFLVHWRTIIGQAGTIQRVLVSLIEISRQRELERTIAEERIRNEQLFSIFNEIQSISQADLGKLVNECKDALALLSLEKMDRSQALRRLHTCKGVARSFRLSKLSQAIHDWETMVTAQGGLSPNARESSQTLLSSYEKFLFERHSEHGDATLLGLCQDILSSLICHAQQNNLNFESIKVDERVFIWPREYVDLLRKILPHILTNAIDHGFIIPSKENGFERSVAILVETRIENDEIRIFVHDNGIGLNMEKIEAMARNRGFVPGLGESWIDVLFHDGVSTAPHVSSTSGRGVGLSSVRELCMALGGRVHLQPHVMGSGTSCIISLPLNAGKGQKAG